MERARRREEKKFIQKNLLGGSQRIQPSPQIPFKVDDKNLQKFSQMLVKRSSKNSITSRSKICYLSQQPQHNNEANEEYVDQGMDKKYMQSKLQENLSVKFTIKILCFYGWSKLRFDCWDEAMFYGRFLLDQERNCMVGLLGIDNILNKMEYTENFELVKHKRINPPSARERDNYDLNFLTLKPEEYFF